MFLSQDKANDFKRSIVKSGDLVFTCWGTINQIGIVDDRAKYNEYVISNKQMKLTPDKSIVYPEYLYYIFSAPKKQQEILNNGIGAAVPGFNLGQLKAHKVLLPSKDEQKKILGVISALDNKIELNRRTNQILEQIAQTLFKSWFVDFDPVRAKVAVREYFEQRAAEHGESLPAPATLEEAQNIAAAAIIAGLTFDPADIGGTRAVLENKLAGMDAEQRDQLMETASLFPEEIIEAPSGQHPKGWKWGTLSNICELNARSWTKKNAPEQVVYVDLANTKNGSINSVETYSWDDAPSRARRILKPGDTIVGTVRPGNRSYARIGRNSSGLTGSTGFAVLTPIDPSWTEFLYIAATNDDAIERLAHLADGGAYPAVRPGVVVEAEMTTPCQWLIEKFSSRVRPMFEMVDTNIQSAHTLAKLRDSLLPKLLSGEIQLNSEPVAEAS